MINVNVSEFDQQRLYLLTHKIKNIKSQYDTDLEKNQECIKGGRYGDNKHIAHMVVGKIYKDCKFNLKEAKEKFLALNSTEIEPYIKESVLEAAYIDYYYTYEKDYE